jgi:hypothetical protein
MGELLSSESVGEVCELRGTITRGDLLNNYDNPVFYYLCDRNFIITLLAPRQIYINSHFPQPVTLISQICHSSLDL